MKSKNIYLVVIALAFALCGTSSFPAQNRQANRLTGTYQLNPNRSDSPAAVADRVARNLPPGRQERLRNAIMRRLEAPEALVFDVQGRQVTMASTHSNLVTIDADGRANTEMSRNGRSQRTTATLYGQKLVVSTSGDRAVDYQVTFEVIDYGRSLRVTRSITDEELAQPVVARSVYDRSHDFAQWDARFDESEFGSSQRRDEYSIVPDGTALYATLNDNLNSKLSRDGDRFTLTVDSPAQYSGASIEGHVVQVNRAGKVAGRAEMALDFDRIRMRDGRTGNFSGYIETVRTANGDNINVDNEGRLQSDNSQTERTVTHTGIGAAIGAVIGAIADGGKGAAIGAAVGAGAGAGSVFVQGRDDLDLIGGTEFRLRSANS
jgi:YmgG-like glycine-zipper protein